MSLVPSGSMHFYDINLFASVQVAVTSAVLYDHVLAVGREIELIWMKPLSLVTALYVVERYLGDVVLMYVLRYLGVVFVPETWALHRLEPACACVFQHPRQKRSTYAFRITTSDLKGLLSIRCIRLFEFRAWGALVYSWATQATMQLRIYAMYRRSRGILTLLLTAFLSEIAAIAFIIWREIGPSSDLQVSNIAAFGERFCVFSGVNGNLVYIFIPFVCFESFLFLLAARMFVENMQQNKDVCEEAGLGLKFRLNSFMQILARDSLCYFFVNLVASAVVMGLWQGVTEIYANIYVPLVLLLEVLVGTRLILGFRERYARPDADLIVSGKQSSLHFRSDDTHMDSPRVSVRCQIETIVVTDVGP